MGNFMVNKIPIHLHNVIFKIKWHEFGINGLWNKYVVHIAYFMPIKNLKTKGSQSLVKYIYISGSNVRFLTLIPQDCMYCGK